MNKKITTILPLHVFDESVEKYIGRALDSIDKEVLDLIIVGPKNVIEKAKQKVEEHKLSDITTYVENENSDFVSQINIAALKCPTKYFNILEFDDYFLQNYSKVALKEVEGEGGSIILPMIEYVKEDNQFVSFGNEIAWDASFLDDDVAEEERDEDYTNEQILGHLTVNQLKTFKDFNVTGGLIKTDDFISCGMLKKSLKIAVWFEFLLRIAHQKHVVRVTPRIIYRHTIEREGSYFSQALNEIGQKEGTWLINRALSEYKDSEDTNAVFSEE